MKKRINISIDPKLFDRATAYAHEVRYTDFSTYITSLIVTDLGRAGAPTNLNSPLAEIAEERLGRLEQAMSSLLKQPDAASRPRATGRGGRGAKGQGRR